MIRDSGPPKRGEIWWANLRAPLGSEPGYRRPVLVIQSNAFNASGINTILVAAITSNLRLADVPGNVRLGRGESGLHLDSVVNVSQIVTADRNRLTERVGRLSSSIMADVDAGLKLALSL